MAKGDCAPHTHRVVGGLILIPNARRAWDAAGGNPGFYTGIYGDDSGQRCKPVPGGGGGGGGGGGRVPDFHDSPLSWGWPVVCSLGVAAALYLAAGVAQRVVRGGGMLPHRPFWRELSGLVVDGVALVTGGGHSRYHTATTAKAHSTGGLASPLLGGGQGSMVGTRTARVASRGAASRLHMAASIGDAVGVRRLLAKAAATTSSSRGELLDGGDKRCYTAFHVACAGGHADCAEALLDAGCDGLRLNDCGLTGWSLAVQLRRSEVLALAAYDPAAVAGAEGKAAAVVTQLQSAVRPRAGLSPESGPRGGTSPQSSSRRGEKKSKAAKQKVSSKRSRSKSSKEGKRARGGSGGGSSGGSSARSGGHRPAEEARPRRLQM